MSAFLRKLSRDYPLRQHVRTDCLVAGHPLYCVSITASSPTSVGSAGSEQQDKLLAEAMALQVLPTHAPSPLMQADCCESLPHINC